MSNGDDEILSVEPVFEGWLSLYLATARLAEQIVKRPIVEHPSGSALLAYDPSRRVAFTVRQTRLPVLYLGEQLLAEAVAGVSEDESPAETARRECREEIGVELQAVDHVGHVWITPSSTTERVHLFLGEYRREDRREIGGGADGELEDLEIREEALADLWGAAVRGEMTDAKLFMLLQALRIKRPELFAANT